MGIQDTTKLLSQLALGGTDTDAQYALNTRHLSFLPEPFTKLLVGRKPLFIADKALTIKSIKMIALGGLTADVNNSNNYTMGKFDGAGGATTAVAAAFSGVANTVAALTIYTFTLTPAQVQMTAGQVLEVVDAVAAGTRNDGLIMFDVVVEYQ